MLDKIQFSVQIADEDCVIIARYPKELTPATDDIEAKLKAAFGTDKVLVIPNTLELELLRHVKRSDVVAVTAGAAAAAPGA